VSSGFRVVAIFSGSPDPGFPAPGFKSNRASQRTSDLDANAAEPAIRLQIRNTSGRFRPRKKVKQPYLEIGTGKSKVPYAYQPMSPAPHFFYKNRK
jgi:hypothetical protein